MAKEKASEASEPAVDDAVAGEKRPNTASDDGGAQKKVAVDGKKQFTGGCHCGTIKYTVDFDPVALQSSSRCNCTFCQKLSITNLQLQNADEDFKLLNPKSKAEVGDYRPKTASFESGNSDAHRYFCTDCGTHVWSEGWYNFGDQRFDFFAVNLAGIDQPQEGVDLSDAKIKYVDGLHDNWFAGQQDKPWSGGLP